MVHISNDAVVEQLIAPSTAAAATTSSSASWDMDNARYATVTINLSSEKNTNATGVVISCRESDATVYSNATTMVADVTKDLAASGNHVIHIHNSGRARYKFISVTPDTTSNGNVSFSASVVKTRLKIGPKSTTEMVASTNDTVSVIGTV